MSKPVPKGTVGTPTQLGLASGNICQTRSSMAGKLADRHTDQNVQQKVTTEKRAGNPSSGSDGVVKSTKNKEDTSSAGTLRRIVDTLSHIL